MSKQYYVCGLTDDALISDLAEQGWTVTPSAEQLRGKPMTYELSRAPGSFGSFFPMTMMLDMRHASEADCKVLDHLNAVPA